MFARDAETGEARWFYQTSPHDLFDHDGVNEIVLADLQMNGQTRKVAMRADRNGLLYVMDRTTRRGAVGDAVRLRQLEPRRRSEDRPADPGRGEGRRSRTSSSATSAPPRRA